MLKVSLYTETKPNLAELVSKYFDGATLIQAKGLWKGNLEDSTIIQIVLDRDEVYSQGDDIDKLVQNIISLNNQEAVLVEYQRVESSLVRRIKQNGKEATEVS